MPELAEVERAAVLIRNLGKGRKIDRVETTDDRIVYGDLPHEDFAAAVVGRTLLDVGRYGKLFYLTLDGPKHPVLHLGMTGAIQIKGEDPLYYRRKPKGGEAGWPPRFMKFIIHFPATGSLPAAQLAFMDARRLGRIRLCASPMAEPPISNLGFDPILCMPTLEEFSTQLLKRGCTIKSLLLDQSFSAGIGNWLADEILYHSKVHPEQPARSLDNDAVKAIWESIVYVCQTAVACNADHNQFPDHWLFPHRWGKGKKTKDSLMLPNGDTATIKWVTVGGRTSAYVQQVQKLRKVAAKQAANEEQADLTPLSDEETIEKGSRKRKASTKRTVRKRARVDVLVNNTEIVENA